MLMTPAHPLAQNDLLMIPVERSFESLLDISVGSSLKI